MNDEAASECFQFSTSFLEILFKKRLQTLFLRCYSALSTAAAYDEQCYLYVKNIEKTNTIVSIFCYFKELEFKMFYSVRLFTNNEIPCETRASENCILVDFSAINAVTEVA